MLSFLWKYVVFKSWNEFNKVVIVVVMLSPITVFTATKTFLYRPNQVPAIHLYELCLVIFTLSYNRISGVIVNVLTLSVVYYGFETWSSQSKDYKIGICCFSSKHAALRRKSKDFLAWNQNNVSEWGDMSFHRLLIQWASTIKIQLSGFHHHFIAN